MFGKNYFRVRELEAQVDKLKDKLGLAEHMEKHWKNQYNSLMVQMWNEGQDARFEVDFAKMNAFSIERIRRDDKLVTVIGYFNYDGANNKIVEEWTLRCSDETHSRLADEFVRYRDGVRELRG